MIYLDAAATTQTDPRVVEAMRPYMTENYLNPAALYSDKAEEAVEKAKVIIADFLDTDPEGVIFTSGGTESDNMALVGAELHHYIETGEKIHILVSNIEHKAILAECDWLEFTGRAKIHYIEPDEYGFITAAKLEEELAAHPEISLVSIMAVNNEIGTVEPFELFGHICHRHDRPILFHTDAVQAIAHERISMRSYDIDMLSLSAHKFNGPKGVGALCMSKRALERTEPILHGGSQQHNRRPGTENVPGIVGMATAIELLRDDWAERKLSVRLVDKVIRDNLFQIPDTIFNGNGYSPGYISVSFKGVDAETLLMILKNKQIFASAGSACNSESVEVSHVLEAIHVPEDYIRGTIRLTFDHNLAAYQAMIACREIADAVCWIRKQ